MKIAGLLCLLAVPVAFAGPYSAGRGDAANVFDAPVPGFTGPAGDGKSPVGSGATAHRANGVNPLFFGWADSVASYARAGQSGSYSDPQRALGPVTGDEFDVVSLGESSAPATNPSGQLTLHLAGPARNLHGADFAVFENALASGSSGQVFGELMHVEVSSDGVNFARFPSVSLTASSVWAFGTFSASGVFNLAGKHQNADGESWGTPFDLTDLSAQPEVVNGTVDLQNINFVRLVDVPGSGGFFDRAVELFNPATSQPYASNHPIYDPFATASFGSAGADIEAVGVISRFMNFSAWLDQRGLAGISRGEQADPDGNGLPNLLDYAFGSFGKNGAPVRAVLADGRAAIEFVRDERAIDLIYRVSVSTDLKIWTPIAQSTGGQPVSGAGRFSPAVTETFASATASIGVLRRVRVSDVATLAESGRRFLRVEVERIAP